MRTLALDPGSTLGWHLSGFGGGHINLGPRSYADQADARNAFSNWLSNLFVEHPVGLVVVEHPTNGNARFINFFPRSLCDVAHDTACRYGIKRAEYSASAVRKWLIGRGRRRTGETIGQFDAALREALTSRGHLVQSEHHADAVALWLYSQHRAGGPA